MYRGVDYYGCNELHELMKLFIMEMEKADSKEVAEVLSNFLKR